ncbi:PLDc N-terminal domain-containing protein [Mycetocola sp.]|uniref:PLDc N-terminal domain-containing protein n=1 Tax=Mycetocola sp. TaxID=1871042 RepID=UPI003988DC35
MTKQSRKKQSKKKKLTWNEMSTGQKVGVIATGLVQMGLATTAWRDLAKRSAQQVNGPKGLWAAIIAVNWVGPIAYFITGRRASA